MEVDADWQEQMALQCAPLVKVIASRLASRLPSHIPLEDLIGAGIIGLMDAIQKFDLSRNVDFKTYAEFRIKGAILDELRSLDWLPRSVREKSRLVAYADLQLQKRLGRPGEAEELAEVLDLETEEFYRILDETQPVFLTPLEEDKKPGNGNPDFTEHKFQELVCDENTRDPFLAIHLSELQEIMVQAINALSEREKLLISLYYYEELTMKEIGQVMGCSESWVSQMHNQAIQRLRKNFRQHYEVQKNQDLSSLPRMPVKKQKSLRNSQSAVRQRRRLVSGGG